MMKKSFFKIVLFACGSIALLPGGNFFAQPQQQTPNQNIKRNSPFAPNPPKKKVELPKTNPQEAINNQSENPVRIENASLTTDNNNAAQTADNEKTAPEKQNPEFESRSVAKKTLEIAKRNSSSSVNAPLTEIYKVGAGDVLDIRILNSPAKDSTLFTVLESGSIDYPLAGAEPVQVSGLMPEEIENILKEKVKLYENPEFAVTVRDYASHTINVLGLVEKPGTKALRREAIPLYVIMAEAIPHATANKATILRGVDKQTITVSLEDNETLIYPNDIIRVVSGEVKSSSNQSQFYFIGGEIASGGQKDFHDGITLTQAILASGGLKKSSTRKVVIRRRDSDGKLIPTEFDLKFIKEGKIADPVLSAGDTIEIGN
jgi:protein involved in polysaccharide export with SLBB domain